MRLGAIVFGVLAAGPVAAETALPEARVLEIFANAPTRPAGFDVETWRIESEPEPEGQSDVPAMALAADMSALTPAEVQSFRAAVSACWVVSEAMREADVSLVVAFSLTPDGLVEDGDVMLQSVSTDDEDLRNEAFEAARRAVLRCQGDGFDLPAEKHAEWRDIEVRFDAGQGATR